jgi:hypothetical protein
VPGGTAEHGQRGLLGSDRIRPATPWPGIFQGVPAELAELTSEPAFDPQNSTFCIWRRAQDPGWVRGPVEYAPGDDPDGSVQLLGILDGDPASYQRFGADYYEVELSLTAVAAIYAHEPVTDALVRQINPESSLGALVPDLTEIDYPRKAG